VRVPSKVFVRASSAELALAPGAHMSASARIPVVITVRLMAYSH
jgi:hypothetical protein